MKWLKLLILLCVITAVVSSLHGRTFYEKLRSKNGKKSFSETESPLSSVMSETPPDKNPPNYNEGDKIFDDKFLLMDDPRGEPAYDLNRAKIMAANQAKEAANCAESQLREKELKFEQIMRKICDINNSINELNDSSVTLKDSIQTILQSRNQAVDLLKHLSDSSKQTKVVNRRMEMTTQIVRDGLQEKITSLENAKERVQNLLCQVKQATQDYEQTQQAALKACDSAKKARVGANTNRWRRLPGHNRLRLKKDRPLK